MILRFKPRNRHEFVIITAIMSQTTYRSENDVSTEVTQFAESFPTNPHLGRSDDFEIPSSYRA